MVQAVEKNTLKTFAQGGQKGKRALGLVVKKILCIGLEDGE